MIVGWLGSDSYFITGPKRSYHLWSFSFSKSLALFLHIISGTFLSCQTGPIPANFDHPDVPSFTQNYLFIAWQYTVVICCDIHSNNCTTIYRFIILSYHFLFFQCSAYSSYDVALLQMGGRISRLNVHVDLKESGSNCSVIFYTTLCHFWMFCAFAELTSP